MTTRVCRLCLGHTAIHYSLLDKQNSHMLECLTGIKINRNDATSTGSCARCILNVKRAYQIQQDLKRNEERLKTFTAPVILPKIEELLQEPQPCNEICMFCGVAVTSDFMAHVQDHFKSPQHCDLCDILLSDLEDYKKHYKSNHGSLGCIVLQCWDCCLSWKYRSLYNIHMEKVHNISPMHDIKNTIRPDPEPHHKRSNFNTENPKVKKPSRRKPPLSAIEIRKKLNEIASRAVQTDKFVCEICKLCFASEERLNRHQVSHAPKECPVCHKHVSRSNFNKHVRNHQSGPQVCHVCGRTLNSEESLRGHMVHTHNAIDFECLECGKRFKYRQAYAMHKKRHAGERSHICDTCGKSFYTYSYLKKHIDTTHLKLRPHVCEYCAKCFSSRLALRTHVRQHTNEAPYRCELCGEAFRQKVSLRTHKKSKHNIHEVLNTACPVCDKMFMNEQAVLSHMRLH